MGDFGFGALVTIIRALGVLLMVALPLAIWKLIEVVIWVFTNVRVTW